jgi:hypothetical protein
MAAGLDDRAAWQADARGDKDLTAEWKEASDEQLAERLPGAGSAAARVGERAMASGADAYGTEQSTVVSATT